MCIFAYVSMCIRNSSHILILGRPWLWIGLAMALFTAIATATISNTCSHSHSHSHQSQLSSLDCVPPRLAYPSVLKSRFVIK